MVGAPGFGRGAWKSTSPLDAFSPVIGPLGKNGGITGKGSHMNEETFQRKLSELIAEIGTLPANERGKLEVLAEQTGPKFVLVDDATGQVIP